MLDTLTGKKIEKSYRAVYLENEYLRVVVLPDLGGHLYEIFDKTANRDVLYTNHVIKYAMVAIRGAWVSGGIEWNFPDGHTLTTVSPIDYATRVDDEGVASVTVGDTERVQRMQWAVEIRLRPGWKTVETEVTLNNRRELPGRYWFWATAAAPAKNDMRFVYPMREAYPHTFWPVFSFPREKGVDIGTYREVPNPLSLFARNSLRDFFGVYYEKSDWGVVHVADHREVPGKKSWTWGTDDTGNIWIEKLTDNDGQYVEFQAGRFETQMEHEWMEPHRVERFTEYWFPVNGMGGGFDEATREAALHVVVERQSLRVSANVNRAFADAELLIESEGRQIARKTVQLDPASTLTATFDLAGSDNRPVVVTLRTREGRELLRYRSDTPADGNPEFKPATRPAVDQAVDGSAEQSFFKGLVADKESRDLVARAAYREALKRDAGFAPAHVALGLSYLRTGEYDTAAEHLNAALRRNRYLNEAHYYLGLVRRAQGRMVEAGDHLTRAARAGYREAAARYTLGEMALAAGKPDDALGLLAQSVALNPKDVKARALLAMAERKAGRIEQARNRIEAVVRDMPIDYLALHEQYATFAAPADKSKADQARAELWRLLSREPDSVLELAFDYAGAGQLDQARAILQESIDRGPRLAAGREAMAAADDRISPVYPMLRYALGYFLEITGDMPAARQQYALGAAADPAFVFPHRLEEIQILQHALAANPGDGRAAYYLGNALASKYRSAEALESWKQAVRLDPGNPVARRNLARALMTEALEHSGRSAAKNRERATTGTKPGETGGKPRDASAPDDMTQRAIMEYEQAIRLAPNDHHLYLELDRLLAANRQVRRRIELLEYAPAAARSQSSLSLALAAAYADAQRYEDAARILEQNSFVTGEGENSALGVYRNAHLGLARGHQKAGRHAQAAAEFVKATEFPRNLGVGRTSTQSQAKEYVAAAREYELAGKSADAEALWRRAADEPLKSPVQPSEPWSEHYYYKALALEHVGRRDEARALYMRLANLANDEMMLRAESGPPEGAIRFVLSALGLKALGRIQDARAAVERGLKLEPGSERLRELQRSLKAN
jgi:cytochrome c-type biogenesis protein CcmH/NrfG